MLCDDLRVGWVRGGGSTGRGYIYHVAVWQKPRQQCKTIILQLLFFFPKNNNKKIKDHDPAFRGEASLNQNNTCCIKFTCAYYLAAPKTKLPSLGATHLSLDNSYCIGYFNTNLLNSLYSKIVVRFWVFCLLLPWRMLFCSL